jgi:hypothetical protein
MTPDLWPEYLVMIAAFLWFGALALFLFVSDGVRIIVTRRPPPIDRGRVS